MFIREIAESVEQVQAGTSVAAERCNVRCGERDCLCGSMLVARKVNVTGFKESTSDV